ncbi:extracellular solute-binding protein [Acetivibrio clariflavus]|uniref:extracellular solute-binding protein n=1 Tax=Acetivibrio clariflavus TaxID=288965 RepID=UPI0004B57B2A|nr:extracellular solute-binding protein [Acetivibrio clariflavus]
MTRKKLFSSGIAVLLSLSMCLSLAGCKKGSGDQTDPSQTGSSNTGPFTIKVYNAMAGTAPAKDNKIYKLIEEKLGVKFEFEFLVGEAKEKAGVMIAGGEYPDLLGLLGDQSGLQEFIDAEALIPLEDYINKYPNLKKHYGPIMNQIKDQKSGHVYVMPNYGVISGKYYQNESFGPAFWIQAAVLKEFGYPKITTLDEWFDIIQQYMKKYPEINGQKTIGFTILTDTSRDWPLRNAPAQLSGHPNDGGVIVDDNVARIYAHLDISKRYYKKLNEMYNAGVIDPECFTSNYDTYISKISSGRVLGLYDQRWNFQMGYNSIIDQKMYERQYVPVPVVFDDSYEQWYLTYPNINVNSGYAITTSCKDPDRVMQVLDTLLSEEWQKILQWGIEGEDYHVDENGRFYRTPEQRERAKSEEWKLSNYAEALLQFCPKLEGSYSDGNATNPGQQPEEYFESLDDVAKEVYTAYNVKTQGELFGFPPENPVYFPAYTISIPVGSDAQIVDQKLKDYAFQYLPKIISAKPSEFEGLWQKYVEQINKLDIAALEKVYNDGIQQRIQEYSN